MDNGHLGARGHNVLLHVEEVNRQGIDHVQIRNLTTEEGNVMVNWHRQKSVLLPCVQV